MCALSIGRYGNVISQLHRAQYLPALLTSTNEHSTDAKRVCASKAGPISIEPVSPLTFTLVIHHPNHYSPIMRDPPDLPNLDALVLAKGGQKPRDFF